MKYIAGVDGGGTKTIAAVSDTNGNIVGLAYGGPSNYHSVGLDNAMRAIITTITSATNSILETPEFEITSLGLAGVGRESDRTLVSKELEKFKSRLEREKGISLGHIILDHDAAIALAGATCDRYGIVVIAGTGAIAFGENARGQRWRASGWGNIVGDEGSAYYVGQRILNAAFRAYDKRGPSTVLADKLIRHFHLKSLEDIVRLIYSSHSPLHHDSQTFDQPSAAGLTSKEFIASLAPLADEAASEGDRVSMEILNDAAAELALAAKVVIKKLKLENEEFILSYSGGVLEGSDLTLSSFIKLIRKSARKAHICKAQLPPVAGALMLGLKEYGVKLTTEVQHRVRESLNKISKTNESNE